MTSKRMIASIALVAVIALVGLLFGGEQVSTGGPGIGPQLGA
jgi:hypothetical protein